MDISLLEETIMLYTETKELQKYRASKRLWQGIPSIEVTKRGRIFLTFYSGGVKEEIGNYVIVIKSDDGGNHFSEPIVIVKEDNGRCFDPCLWIDPLGELWLTWAKCPDDGLYASVCRDPDAEELVWGEEFLVGHNVMMNKPIVVKSGEWLFPIAVWNDGIRVLSEEYDTKITEKGSFVYATNDCGKTFQKLGFADVKDRHYDEHMILEMKDGSLRMFVRTKYGIGASNSYDGGRSWSKDFDTGYGGPCSRFHITRLRSGRILLINHFKFSGRNNLTAMLSEDEGKTFPYKLLLDEREVSYPDAKEADDGFIYVTYDRERGSYLYYLHADDPKREVGEIIETLNSFVREGKVRYFACSNWSAERMWAADAYAKEHNLKSFVGHEIMFNLAKPNDEAVEAAVQTHMTENIYEYHQKTGKPVTAYTSQAAGFFVLHKEEGFLKDDKFAFPRDMFYNAESLKRAERVDELCKLTNATPLEITLAYLYAQPFQVIPIVGPCRVKELEESLRASEKRLTQEEVEFLFS